MWLYCALWTIKCLDYIMMSLFVTVDAPETRETLVNFFHESLIILLLKMHKYSTQIKCKFIRTCIVQSYRTDALQMNLVFSVIVNESRLFRQ